MYKPLDAYTSCTRVALVLSGGGEGGGVGGEGEEHARVAGGAGEAVQGPAGSRWRGQRTVPLAKPSSEEPSGDDAVPFE